LLALLCCLRIITSVPSLCSFPYSNQPSPFFTEQLTAFEVWLDHGSEDKKPPEQLPIVLQVLLSQSHRFRALVLLGRFLDMGPWAVDLALSVGIFPYVLKLLQTSAMELRQILVFIWTKILSLDKVVFYVENLKSLTVHFISQDSGIYLVALFFK
jgi:regulator-associated protein of mTOR